MSIREVYNNMKSNFCRLIVAFVLIAVFLLAFLLGACSVREASAETNAMFSTSGSVNTGDYRVSVLTDKEYGVEYLVVWKSDRPYDTLAVTPRYRSTEFLR